MAPKSKKSKTSSSTSQQQPIDAQIKHWLKDPIAITRWNKMKDYTIHEGMFIKYFDFLLYDVKEIATKSKIASLLSFEDNNVEINHIMIKLFYANLNLEKYKPANSSNCLWSVVCDQQVFISKSRMEEVLKSSNNGTKFSSDFCPIHIRDKISHLFIEDHKSSAKGINLRPTARILHHCITHSLLP